MEFVVCDSEKREIGAFNPQNSMLDFELGDTNDVEISCPRGSITRNQYVVCFGTEYGALMEEYTGNTNSSTETWRGNSFRRFLDEIIVEPPSGKDYLVMSGDAHDIMREVLNNSYDGMFTISEQASGINFTNYQFDRYVSALSAFSKMLATKDARINIDIKQGGSNEPFFVELSAVPVNNLSEEIQFSEDSKVNITISDNQRGITKLICLGRGDLKDRQVVYLYAWPDGSVQQREYYTGLRRRTAVYDNAFAETLDDLIDGGVKRLKELMGYKNMSMSVKNIDLQIGDIVSGRIYATNTYLSKPVIQKILSISNGSERITYKVKGEQ